MTSNTRIKPKKSMRVRDAYPGTLDEQRTRTIDCIEGERIVFTDGTYVEYQAWNEGAFVVLTG